MIDTLHVIEKNGLRLVIDELEGMNVNELSYEGKNLILCNEKRKANGATYAIPVLFPTPNRVKNNSYEFDGNRIDAVMHGFLRHEKFVVDEENEGSIKAHYDFDGKNPLFPYVGRITIIIEIIEKSAKWTFIVENNDEKKLSYSLALHPFFTKDELERIYVDTAEEMLNDDEKIPTGETRKVEAIDKKTEDVNMDTVFIVNKPFDAKMIYKNFDMVFKASDDFEHVVVYSSTDKNFLCIEPQTGSTDAHNLSAKGFRREAGLIEVEPGETHHSEFTLSFENK